MAPAKSKAPKEEQPAEDSAIESAEREMLTRELTIKNLEKKLARTEASISRVTAENKQLKLSLEEAQETLRDVSDHLTRELSSKESKLIERTAAAHDNEKKLEESRSEFEQQMLSTKQEKDIEILKAKDAAMQAEHKLADLSEFMAKKSDLEKELAELKDRLAEEQSNTEARVSELERKHILEKDQLRKKMNAKIEETRNIYSSIANLDMESQDRRVLVENEKLTLELLYQSRETEKMIDKNSNLLSENKKLKSELRLMKECNQQFAQENNRYKRSMKIISSKVTDMEILRAEKLEQVSRSTFKATELQQDLDALVAQHQSVLQDLEAARCEQEEHQALEEEKNKISEATKRYVVESMHKIWKLMLAASPDKEGFEDQYPGESFSYTGFEWAKLDAPLEHTLVFLDSLIDIVESSELFGARQTNTLSSGEVTSSNSRSTIGVQVKQDIDFDVVSLLSASQKLLLTSKKTISPPSSPNP